MKKAVKKSGFKITEVVSGKEPNGVDSLGEQWADENNIPVKEFPAEWNNLKLPGADIRLNKWKKKYVHNAGFLRNQDMADYADALIAIPGQGGGTHDMIKRAKEKKLKVFVYDDSQKSDEEYEYHF